MNSESYAVHLRKERSRPEKFWNPVRRSHSSASLLGCQVVLALDDPLPTWDFDEDTQADLLLCRFEATVCFEQLSSSARMLERPALNISSANEGALSDTARDSNTAPTMWLKSEIAWERAFLGVRPLSLSRNISAILPNVCSNASL